MTYYGKKVLTPPVYTVSHTPGQFVIHLVSDSAESTALEETFISTPGV